MQITAEEGRVLGCLVEKQLTTPQLYPLTDNALLGACNQTTARDPVVSYDIGTLRLAVRGLREAELLRTVHRTGERSDKHQHRLQEALGLSGEQVALLAMLLLRGPQTPSELRTRTERMHAFGSSDDVLRVLGQLADRDEPLVAVLERQAGRKETRYAELLVGSAGPPAVGEPAVHEAAVGKPGVHEPAVHEPAGRSLAELGAAVDALRAEMAALREQVDRLSR